MAGLTNFKPQQPFEHEQIVKVGLVIVTQDAQGEMVDVHDRRPVVLEPNDVMRWMDPATPLEEAAHVAYSRSLATEAFTWWKVDRTVNRVNPYNNGKHLIAPITP